MLSVSDWGKLITDEKGRLMSAGVAQALADARAWPLLKVLPFVPKQGSAYIGNFAGASAEKATRAMNAGFTESAPTVAQQTFPMRAAGGELKLDINMIDGDNTGMIRAGILTQKIKDVGARLFRMWFNGDKDAVGGDEWDGVDQVAADFGTQIVAGANGAALTSDMMDSALEKVPGATVILCNRTLARKIDGFSVGVQKTVALNQGGLTPDMFVQTYKGVPILPVGTAPHDTTAVQTDILGFNETQGSSNACSRVTVARIGLDGLYGIQHKLFELSAARREGAFEIVDMNWFMAGVAADTKDCLAQVIGVTNA
jgi:hypothetical protein